MKQVCLLLCVIAAAVAAVPARPAAGVAQIAAEPMLPGEWFVAKSDAEVMSAAVEVLRQMGVKLERRDLAAGVLVTRRAEYGVSWPDAAVLGLPTTHQPAAATLHVFVAPGFRPARLAVGAILETRTTFAPLAGRRGRGETRLYGERHLGAAIAERIAASLRTPLVAMPHDPEARSREAARLGDATAARCGAPALVTRESKHEGPPPTLVSQVKPVYPGNEDRQRVTGTVVLAAEVTEHGTLTGLTRQGGADRPNLVAAASGAAGLWRFRPAPGDCPARRGIGIEMAFLMP